MSEVAGPVLLFDGTCGFCAGSVRFVLRHDRRGTLRFAPLQSPFGQRIVEQHPQLQNIDSVVWFDESNAAATAPGGHRISVRSEAAIRVGEYLGGFWSVVARFARLVPRPIRDAAYNLIARYRYQLSRQQCLLPSAEERRRFVDN
jgi:predicted DCC family thiol-disulfide oxidoreductase YuxK